MVDFIAFWSRDGYFKQKFGTNAGIFLEKYRSWILDIDIISISIESLDLESISIGIEFLTLHSIVSVSKT